MLGFVAHKVHLPSSPKIHEMFPCSHQNPHFFETAPDESPLLATKRVLISKTIISKTNRKAVTLKKIIKT